MLSHMSDLQDAHHCSTAVQNHTSREDQVTPAVHVPLIALVAVIIPVQVLLHILIVGHIIGVVWLMRQAEAVTMLSIIPVLVHGALAVTRWGGGAAGRGPGGCCGRQ